VGVHGGGVGAGGPYAGVGVRGGLRASVLVWGGGWVGFGCSVVEVGCEESAAGVRGRVVCWGGGMVGVDAVVWGGLGGGLVVWWHKSGGGGGGGGLGGGVGGVVVLCGGGG